MTTTNHREACLAEPVFLPRLPHQALTRYLPETVVLGLARQLGWAGRRRAFVRG